MTVTEVMSMDRRRIMTGPYHNINSLNLIEQLNDLYPKTSTGNTRPIAASNSFVAQTRRYYTSTHNTQPHHQKRHTWQLGGSSAAAGSFAVVGSFAVANSLGAAGSSAAARHWQRQLGCGRQLGSGGNSTAAGWRLRQLGGGKQLGGGSGSLMAARPRRRQWQHGNGSGSLAAVAAW